MGSSDEGDGGVSMAMAGQNPIRELGSTVGFRGPMAHRTAEPGVNTSLPVIDNTDQSAPNVRTSVDCYVSGQYLGRRGNTIEVVQRYTVFVSYSRNTQKATMDQLRDRITNDFSSRYGSQFNVSGMQIPGLPIPDIHTPGVNPGEVAPVEFYWGSKTYREMTRTTRLRYDIGTQGKIRDLNVGSLKKRYGVR
jgi:hypothetical protein